MSRDAWWMGVRSASSHAAPLATSAHRRRQHHHHKRWRSPNPTLVSCTSETRGPLENRRVWYNPERTHSWRGRKNKRPRLEPIRHWVQSDNFSSNLTQEKFVIMSYNILGNDNASNHGHLYVNIPFDSLRWGSRKVLICQEICRWNADIVCLQEVDRYNDILTSVKKEGYAGRFKRRTGEAKDGCAILWKEKRQLCEDSSRRIVVGNIHVLFNPKRGDIKLGQVRMLLSKAHALSEKWDSIPVVLGGDFNSTPMSPIYEFFSTSELDIAKCDRRDLSGQERLQSSLYIPPRLLKYCWSSEELKNATGDSKCTKLVHPLKLQSAYVSVKSNARTRGPFGEPLATSYHSKFLGTVDYLWYSTGIACTRVLDTLPIDTLKNLGGLPSKNIGSDHLALAAEFVFTKCRESQEQEPVNSNETEEKKDCHSPQS